MVGGRRGDAPRECPDGPGAQGPGEGDVEDHFSFQNPAELGVLQAQNLVGQVQEALTTA